MDPEAESTSEEKQFATVARAFISVVDPSGLVALGHRLAKLGVEILSTGGTAGSLREAGVAVREERDLTDFPEILEGRLQNQSVARDVGVLDRGVPGCQHRAIDSIDLVVVNLYRSRQKGSQSTAVEGPIENVSVAAHAAVRWAAKHHMRVTVIVDPRDYDRVLREIENKGGVSAGLRFDLCRRAFKHTAAYDSAIANYLDKLAADSVPIVGREAGAHVAAAVSGITDAKAARDLFVQLLDLLSCELEEAFRLDVDDFEACEANGTWADWIAAQSWLIWAYKGCPQSQSETAEKDDYMHAQRYLAFLVADHVLAGLREERCPLELLTEEKVRYLEKLSVHEYVQFSAYFRYKTRLAAAPHAADAATSEREDYVAAGRALEASFATCIHRVPAHTSCLVVLRALQSEASRNMDAAELTNVKLRQLTRLHMEHEVEARVRRYVNTFYHAAGYPGQEDAVALLDTIAKSPAVPTIFELMVTCFVAHCAGKRSPTTESRTKGRAHAPIFEFQ